MKNQKNLLFPEWQGYGKHQEVYHGAHQICNHLRQSLEFSEVHVSANNSLKEEDGILGKSNLLDLLERAGNTITTANPSQLFMVGGTCACEIAPISYMNEKYDNDLAIFWFDAHGDLNTPESSPSHRLHGMPLRCLLGEGDADILKHVSRIVTPSQVALVGARDLDDGEKAFVESSAIPIFKPDQISQTAELIDFTKSAGFTRAYIHFDLDVLEPTAFEHVLVPVEDGLSVNAAIESLKLIRQHFFIAGCSVVEFCPKHPLANRELLPLITEGLGIVI